MSGNRAPLGLLFHAGEWSCAAQHMLIGATATAHARLLPARPFHDWGMSWPDAAPLPSAAISCSVGTCMVLLYCSPRLLCTVVGLLQACSLSLPVWLSCGSSSSMRPHWMMSGSSPTSRCAIVCLEWRWARLRSAAVGEDGLAGVAAWRRRCTGGNGSTSILPAPINGHCGRTHL